MTTDLKNIENETESKIKSKLDFSFIRINPDGIDFDIFVEIGKIFNDINESTEKSLIHRISKKTTEIKI